METKFNWTCAAVLLFAYNGSWAQDDGGTDPGETTIRLMGAAEAELPDAVTKQIALPDAVSEDAAAVENAQQGIDTANENRARREQGLATADEARERGAEMAEDAQENRENRGRSDDRPERPDTPNVPDNPGPPSG